MRPWLLVLPWFLLASGPAFAQDAPVLLRGGRVLDGQGGVIENATVTIRGARVTAVTTAEEAPTYDLSEFTIMPGGIDTHVHIGWHFDTDGKTHDAGPDEETDQQAMLYAVENAFQTLLAGITTVQSLGARVDVDLRDWIARGTVPGPRVLTSIRSLNNRTGDPSALREAVRRLDDDGADVIKIFASASIRNGGTPTMSQEQLDAACGEAATLGLRTAVHAHGPESAQRAIRAGCTVIEHGALLDVATLDLMVEHGTYFDPNIGLVFQNYLGENRQRYQGVGNYTEEGFTYMEQAVGSSLDIFREALRRPGLQVVFGTDAVAGAHGRNFEEIIYRVEEGGQSPGAALVSATSVAARSLGLEHEIGSLTPGLQADIIAVDGNPLEDITALRRVVFVMKGGRVFKNTTNESR